MKTILLSLTATLAIGVTAQASAIDYNYSCKENGSASVDLTISEAMVSFKGVKAVRSEPSDSFTFTESSTKTTVSVGGEIGAKRITLAILGEPTLNRTETYLCSLISE